MGTRCTHFTRAAGALVFGIIAACAGGCWEEIEYTGPDPSTVVRRERPRRAETDRPPETGPSESAAATVAPETRPAAAPERPTVAAEPPEDTVDPSQPNDEQLASDESPFDDEPEVDLFPQTDGEPAASEPARIDPTVATRRAAWQLGSKLTLAALAHDRGLVPADAAAWFDQARTVAEKLDTSVAELPKPVAVGEGDGGSRRVHDYLFQQGQKIYRDLSSRHGADHAALFEVAVKSNVLLVLYEPGSPSVDALANSIRTAAPQAGLPAELWQPLLDKLTNQSPAAAVRLAVRQMHADVAQYLAGSVEP